VPPRLQLVQQVKQAVRLGILHPGDQLPTVKQVVTSLSINPNTVLKLFGGTASALILFAAWWVHERTS
jgi:GntR family transcriptional regulator